MNDNQLELASRYRDILRQAVFLVRSMDSDGELSIGQLSTLNMVAAEPLRVGAIARNSGIRVPSATEQVIKLEAAGLVERVADADDARVVLVRLTEQGLALREKENRHRNAAMARALEILNEKERDAISIAIPAIAKLNAALTKQPSAG